MSTHNLCFEQKYEKYQKFYLKIFIFFGGKIFSIFKQACFRNGCLNGSRSLTIPDAVINKPVRSAQMGLYDVLFYFHIFTFLASA